MPMSRRLRHRMLLFLVLSFLLPGGCLSAQQGDAAGPLAFSVGALRTATGDDRCGRHATGFGLGLEARTHGTWFGGVGVDLLTSGSRDCADIARVTTFDGAEVEVHTSRTLELAPRARVRAGVALPTGWGRLEISGGAGLIRVGGDYGAAITSWFGGFLGFRSPHLPLGVRLEYGRWEEPVRYVDSGAVVREFTRGQPILGLALTF